MPVLFDGDYALQGILTARPLLFVPDEVHEVRLVREDIVPFKRHDATGEIISDLETGRTNHGHGTRALGNGLIDVTVGIPPLVHVHRPASLAHGNAPARAAREIGIRRRRLFLVR